MVWVLRAGARWCDIPIGEQWASRACAHKYLGLWKVNSLLERLLIALQEICAEAKAIDLTRPTVIPYRWMGKNKPEPSRKVLANHRWKVERGRAWLKRKYRRLAVRWDKTHEILGRVFDTGNFTVLGQERFGVIGE